MIRFSPFGRCVDVLLGACFLIIVSMTQTFAQEEMTGEEAIELDSATLSASLEPIGEIIPSATDEELEARLKSIEKDIQLSFNRTVRGFIDYFTIKNRRYPLVMERRKNLYFPIFEEVLKKHGMPEELKYLAIVESGLNPRAVS